MRSLPPTMRVPLHTLILMCLYHYVFVCHGQHYVNIALLKTCWQSSTYGSGYEASKAVDNKTDTWSHTHNRAREWWDVDLYRNYQIKDIRIYPHPKLHSRVAQTTITVDSRACARVPQNIDSVVSVSCENITYGRRVRITKDDKAGDPYLSIAEFQVIGCQQGYYGYTCNLRCLSSYCLNDECDRLSGQCIACNRNYKAPECIECNDNWYGQLCDHECTWVCYNNISCNKMTGFCHKCPPGFQGNHCNAACPEGRYGQDCAGMCGNCLQGTTCDALTGHCLRCSAGFVTKFCNKICDRGKYGEDCKYDCGSCADSQDCDKINGSCQKCVPGKKVPYCKSSCDRWKYGEDCKYDCGSCADSQDCDKINGTCLKCVPGKKLPYCKSSCTNGTFGSDCVKVCHCKDGQPCNVITGECSDACAPGWTSKTCDQSCETGKYGQDCLQECGHCAGNAVCKVTTGHCPSCTPGMNPPLCKDACKNGTYGGDCSKTCGHCKDGQPCNVITGECVDGCTAGWTSKTCDQSLVSFDVVIIAGAIIGGFLILAVSISVPLWLKWFKHRSVEESNRKQVQLQISSFNRKHLQAQADLPIPLETGVDYDNMGNPYDSLDISVLDDDAKYTQPAFTKIKTSTVKDTAN